MIIVKSQKWWKTLIKAGLYPICKMIGFQRLNRWEDRADKNMIQVNGPLLMKLIGES